MIFSRDSFKKKQEPSADRAPVGGFAFFLSLALLVPSSILLLAFSLSYLSVEMLPTIAVLVASMGGGSCFAKAGIKRHLSVFLHETKHSIISSIVGNKRKGMRVNANSGYFEYSYTKETAHFNFLIALAPYILPVFLLIATVVLVTLRLENHHAAVAIAGVAYGIDLLLNLRDISPIQTDISLIRGGYWIGLSYIYAWNLAIFTLVLAWSVGGAPGLLQLLADFSILFLSAHPAAPAS